MLKKFFVYLLFFTILISPVFSATDSNFLSDSFNNILGSNGLGGLIIDDVSGNGKGYVTASLIFIALLITFHNLLGIAFKMALPKKEANIIAFSISLIGNLGLIFIFNNGGGVLGYIALFGGTIGITFMAIIFVVMILTMDKLITKTHERFKSRYWWFWISLVVFFATTVIINLMVKVYGSTDNVVTNFLEILQSIAIFILIILVGVWFFFFRGSDEFKESPTHIAAKQIFKGLDEDIKSIDESFKEIKNNLEAIK